MCVSAIKTVEKSLKAFVNVYILKSLGHVPIVKLVPLS